MKIRKLMLFTIGILLVARALPAWGDVPFTERLSNRERGLFVLDATQATVGACCNTLAGVCTDNVQEENCHGTFLKGSDCADIPCEPCLTQHPDGGGTFSDINCDECGAPAGQHPDLG